MGPHRDALLGALTSGAPFAQSVTQRRALQIYGSG